MLRRQKFFLLFADKTLDKIHLSLPNRLSPTPPPVFLLIRINSLKFALQRDGPSYEFLGATRENIDISEAHGKDASSSKKDTGFLRPDLL